MNVSNSWILCLNKFRSKLGIFRPKRSQIWWFWVFWQSYFSIQRSIHTSPKLLPINPWNCCSLVRFTRSAKYTNTSVFDGITYKWKNETTTLNCTKWKNTQKLYNINVGIPLSSWCLSRYLCPQWHLIQKGTPAHKRLTLKLKILKYPLFISNKSREKGIIFFKRFVLKKQFRQNATLPCSSADLYIYRHKVNSLLPLRYRCCCRLCVSIHSIFLSFFFCVNLLIYGANLKDIA